MITQRRQTYTSHVDFDHSRFLLVDDSNSECTDSQLNAEHWLIICLIIINNYSNL